MTENPTPATDELTNLRVENAVLKERLATLKHEKLKIQIGGFIACMILAAGFFISVYLLSQK